MRLCGMPGMGLLISPGFRTYIANKGIWHGSIPMYAIMFLVTSEGDSTSFRSGGDILFHDAHMIYVG